MSENPTRTAKALKGLQIAVLNPMQLASLEAHGSDRDVVLLAPTGSGKTLAFLLPMLEELDPETPGIQALILAPSRELALQTEDVFRRMGTGFKVNCFYGGHPFPTEVNNLSEPPAVLIGTPGRIADHLRRETFRPDPVRWLVLDEFDKSLQLGFEEQMRFIISQLSGLRKRTLLSATAMKGIPGFVGLQKPVELNYLTGAPPEGLALKKVATTSADKLETLFRLLCRIGNEATLIFCNHRDAAGRIHSTLSEWGLVTGLYHGGLEQDERERALIKFRNGSTRLLITTDLASRGLDIPEIRNVIHYQLPDTPEAFVHRNGRTARMHAEGKAYLLIAEEDTVPPYLTGPAEAEEAPEAPLPPPPPWVTIHFSAGKKEKIGKTDVVGLLTQKGKLPKEGVGRIEIGDHASFVAVDRTKARKVLELVKEEKIKGIKVKIRMAR